MRGSSGREETQQDWRSFQRRSRRPNRRSHPWKIAFRFLGFLFLSSVICVSFLYAAKGSHRSSRVATPRPSPKDASRSFSSAVNGAPPHFDRIRDGKFMEERDSYQLTYSIDPALQAAANEIFRTYRPRFSAFAAVEPQTGKILALTDYSRGNSGPAGIWQRATYPAASVFKVITAAGALEKGILNFDSPVSYQGNKYRLGPKKLTANSRRELRTNFDEALGKSNNVVFGRVASNLLGSQALRQMSEAFRFNQPLRFDFPLENSRAIIPEEGYELARCGAGFGEVTLNPLHGALIAATVANRGIMMRPYLIEEISSREGERLYGAKAEVLAQPISARTAEDLSRMMLRTVEDGTASKTFRRYGKGLLKRMSICGKTGHLSGHNPPGLYDWFIGFAPGENPKIAFAVMIINQDRWRVKGTYVAEEALKTFFRERTS